MRWAWVAAIGVAACGPRPDAVDPSENVELAVPAMPTVPPAASTAASPATTANPNAGRCVTPMAENPRPIPPPAAHCPVDPQRSASLPVAEFGFESGLAIEAELAKNEHDIQKGLMYRRSMSDGQGMFFKLDRRRDQQFWMHNTCIPLDMLFIEDDGLIVGVVEGAAPLTDSVRSCGCPSSFVLEVNAGWVRKNGIKPGQRITIPFSAR